MDSRITWRTFIPFFILLATLLVAETALRISNFGLDGIIHLNHYNGLSMYQSDLRQKDKFLGYKLQRNYSGYFKGGKFDTNAQGWRITQPAPLAEEKSPLTIVLLGRSLTMGSGVSNEETYAWQLREHLTGELGREVQIINMGVGGWSIKQMIRSYQKYRKNHLAPDAIIVPLGYGDFLIRHPKKISEYVDRTWDDAYQYLNHSFLYLALQEQAKEWIGEELLKQKALKRSPAEEADYMKRAYEEIEFFMEPFLAKLHEEKTPVYLLNLHLIESARSDETIASVTQEMEAMVAPWENAQLVDSAKDFLDEKYNEMNIYPGDAHPNADLHALFAEDINRKLAPLLRQQLEKK